MLQFRHDRFHMRPHLFFRPGVACHMFHAKLDQLLLAGISKRAARITPLAIFLIKRTVRFPADRGVLQRHPTALTDQLLRGTQQRVDGNVKQVGQPLQRFRICKSIPNRKNGKH